MSDEYIHHPACCCSECKKKETARTYACVHRGMENWAPQEYVIQLGPALWAYVSERMPYEEGWRWRIDFPGGFQSSSIAVSSGDQEKFDTPAEAARAALDYARKNLVLDPRVEAES